MNFRYWLVSIRSPLLIVGLGPVLLGISIALSQLQSVNLFLNGMIVLCVLCIQIATHFFNDALDFLKGADNPNRIGPHRMVQKRYLLPSSMMKVGGLCLILATLTGGYLVFIGGWPVFLVGTVSLALAYLYTGGPYPLAYTGLSDLFVVLFFGLIPTPVVFYLNTGYWEISTVVAGLQCGFLALSVLLVNHLRDFKEDQAAGKRTLVVRFGLSFGMIEWTIVRWIPYLLGFYWWFHQEYLTVFLPFLFLPFAFLLQCFLLKAPANPPLYNKILGLTCVYHFLFVSALIISFWF